MPSTLPLRRTLTIDLRRLRFADTVELGQAVRALGQGATTQQQAAQRLVEHLYTTFCEPQTSEPQTALVRCFKTHPLRLLPEPMRSAAYAALPPEQTAAEIPKHLRCLTLLGTRGAREEWNQPQTSVGHQAIPLPDITMVHRAPMISALFSQMGVNVPSLLSQLDGSFVLDRGQQSFNVFHVEDARGSELIPAQQTFVLPYGIRSVVGMGGLMPSGELFAVILFAKVHVSRETAELFRTLALSVKLLFLPFAASQVFPGPSV